MGKKHGRETQSSLTSETSATNAPPKKSREKCLRVRGGKSPYFENKCEAEEHHPPVRLSSRPKWTPPRSPFNLVQVLYVFNVKDYCTCLKLVIIIALHIAGEFVSQPVAVAHCNDISEPYGWREGDPIGARFPGKLPRACDRARGFG